ncbi:MAG TPA: 30S ribosomal protein S4 [bacterium]|nr:30S ribosomal protein S4 [bacterium]
MAKVVETDCKVCRKYGIKLYLKGIRCESDKCAIDPRRKNIRLIKSKKTSEYGHQLREKNKVKIYYGVRERQFRRYFEMAKKQKGVTGENLLQLLERRLDNVVYRANFVSSRKQAKQIISHGAVIINGRKADRDGYIVKEGEEIKIKTNIKYIEKVKENIDIFKHRQIPTWMKVNNENYSIEIVRYPTREEVSIPVDEQLIINLYSK